MLVGFYRYRKIPHNKNPRRVLPFRGMCWGFVFGIVFPSDTMWHFCESQRRRCMMSSAISSVVAIALLTRFISLRL